MAILRNKKTDSPLPSSPRLKILFADDEPTLQELMSMELPRMGHRVTVCPDGESAVREIQQHSFDCVLVDLDMPGISGIEVIRRVKERSPDTESIVLTGKESLGSWFEQALIARRQEAFCFTAETKLEFQPDNFQQCAGLVCYYNAHKYHYLYISVDGEGRRFVDIMSCEADITLSSTYPLTEERNDTHLFDSGFRLPDQGAIWLKCDVDHQAMVFSWSDDGDNWRALPITLDYSLISDETGKGEGGSFTGAFVGMACQDLSGQDCPADFDSFHYIERS